MSNGIATYPDAVGAWVEYLQELLEPPVGGQRNEADLFLRVRRAGGGGGTRITDNAQMVFEAYGPYADDAARLANHSRAHVFAAAGKRITEDAFCKTVTNVSAPAELPDPDRPDLVRYSFTVLTAMKAQIVAPEQLRGTPAP